MPAGNGKYKAGLIFTLVVTIAMGAVLTERFSRKEWGVSIPAQLSRSDFRDIRRLVETEMHRLLPKYFSWRSIFSAVNLKATIGGIRARSGERVHPITV